MQFAFELASLRIEDPTGMRSKASRRPQQPLRGRPIRYRSAPSRQLRRAVQVEHRSHFRDQWAHDRRRRSTTLVARRAARRCHCERHHYSRTAACRTRSAAHRDDDCHWQPIFQADAPSPIGATRLFACRSYVFGLFLISIGIRLVASASLAAVISNLSHPLKIGYLAPPEPRRRRVCSHNLVVRSCYAGERALFPCEICFFCVPLFARNRSGAGFCIILRGRSVFSLRHDHKEVQFPVVAFNCRTWMRSVTRSIRCRNKQADHRPRDRGQKRNQTKGVAQQRHHGGSLGTEPAPTQL
jgi:hypothetical protein